MLIGLVIGNAPNFAAVAPQQAASGEKTARFSLCHTGGGHNCVVDGDIIWVRGEKIRLADVDAPETHDSRCPAERELADRATVRLQSLLNSGSISLETAGRDEDRYGRKLRIIMVDGRSVGDMLIDERLARPYEGGRKPWC